MLNLAGIDFKDTIIRCVDWENEKQKYENIALGSGCPMILNNLIVLNFNTQQYLAGTVSPWSATPRNRQLPILKVDNEIYLHENAIEEYCAIKAGIVPKSPEALMRVKMITGDS